MTTRTVMTSPNSVKSAATSSSVAVHGRFPTNSFFNSDFLFVLPAQTGIRSWFLPGFSPPWQPIFYPMVPFFAGLWGVSFHLLERLGRLRRPKMGGSPGGRRVPTALAQGQDAAGNLWILLLVGCPWGVPACNARVGAGCNFSVLFLGWLAFRLVANVTELHRSRVPARNMAWAKLRE